MRRPRNATILRRLAELLTEVSAPDTSPRRFFEIFAAAEEMLESVNKRATTFRKEHSTLLEAMVRHPNIPPELLYGDERAGIDPFHNGTSLIEAFPDAFLANPAAPLLPLERPDFTDEIGADAMLRLLMRADAPPIYVAVGRTYFHPVIRDAAQNHIQTTGELSPDGAEWEAQARDMVSGLFLPTWQMDTVWELLETGLAPEWLGERFRESGLIAWWREEPPPDTPQARARAVAMNPETPLTTLEALARSSEVGVRLAVWSNPSRTHSLREEMLSALLLKRLVSIGTGWENERPDLHNFLALAAIPWDARYQVWHTEGGLIFQNPQWDYVHPATRLALAVNPHTPPEIRNYFATREGHCIVRAAAQAFLRHGRALL